MSDCCARANVPLILACAGASNVGQMTNRIAVELTESEYGKLFCLAGIGGGIESFVKSAQAAEDIIVLDGCPVGCARKTLENIGVAPKNAFELTAMGMQKNKNLRLDEAEVQRLAQEVKLGSAKNKMAARGAGCSCCG